MTEPATTDGQPTRPPGFLNRIHQSSKHYLPQWLGVPAHIHHVAHRMANPPMERPNSRREFQHLLQALEITEGRSRKSSAMDSRPHRTGIGWLWSGKRILNITATKSGMC